LPQIEAKDSFYWRLTSSRQFSTKTATWTTHKNFDLNDPKWAFNWIWKLDIMPMIKVFLWQTLHNALLLHGVLVKRCMSIDPSCPLSGDDIETIDHLFWGFSLTRRI